MSNPPLMKSAVCLFLMLTATMAADRQSTFEFHSSFWLNLHHFLYEQAISKEPATSDSAAWRRAVDFYRREIVKSELLSSALIPINEELSHAENAKSLKGVELPENLAIVLEEAAPPYRERWWPEHNKGNLDWIEKATPLIAKFESAMKKELATAYGVPWPETLIRTDVAEYANWAGAYTALDPTHITISSMNSGNLGQASLETLFHEASHAMMTKINRALQAELDARKVLLRRRTAWHAILFYTVGEVSRRHLDNYTSYAVAHGLYDSWDGVLPVLERDWKPYLNGEIDFNTAIRKVVEDYSIPRKE